MKPILLHYKFQLNPERDSKIYCYGTTEEMVALVEPLPTVRTVVLVVPQLCKHSNETITANTVIQANNAIFLPRGIATDENAVLKVFRIAVE